jgi:pimeloyl-ACP methyl ester carboxylesterase
MDMEMKKKYGPDNPEITYIPHNYSEHLFDTGEIKLNYVSVGSSEKPAIVLIPGQTESWWGYEKAIALLTNYFQVFAVDLRGQGRSSRTPGRYTFDNFGNDLVRFIAFEVKRPVVVSGLSSGGVISAWLSAYAPPGMIRGAHYEDPPLFACELIPAFGPGLRQATFRMWELFSTYLGDQWRVSDWEGLQKVVREEFPPIFLMIFEIYYPMGPEPPQNLKEYDPEWAKAFVTGSVGASCDHFHMLTRVKCPVLFTHHFSEVDEKTGDLMGASTVRQVDQVENLVKEAGQPFTRLTFPEMGHFMHDQDPELFVRTLIDWEKTLPTEAEPPPKGGF